MSATTDDTTVTDWTELEEYDGIKVGAVARPRRIRVDTARVSLLRQAVDMVAGSRTDWCCEPRLEEVCPDPFVLAMAAGLPRPRRLDRQIDGGSSWVPLAPLGGDEELLAVSSVAAVDRRRTEDGRHLVRVVYLTELVRPGSGELVGRCTGTSLDVQDRP